jgi:hypothetical protein
MSPSRVPGLRLTPKGWAALEAAGYRWRRRRARPLDWSDPESPIYCPELTTPGGYVRRVSRYPKDSRFKAGS